MKRTTVQLYNRKSLELCDSSSTDPAIWLRLSYNKQEVGYALCGVETARKLVEVLNTFIAEH